jgi:transcriptional regulator with XRE-family HTH domain
MSDDIKKKISKRVRELRGKRGYTQEKLSELTGIEYKHIQRIESKIPCDLKASTLEKLAKAFKMSISEFMELE